MSELINNLVAEEQHSEGRNPSGCKDGGTCHHDCRNGCFREKNCVPLAISNLDDNWKPLKAGDFQDLKNELSETKAVLERTNKTLLNIYNMTLDVGEHGDEAEITIEQIQLISKSFLADQKD